MDGQSWKNLSLSLLGSAVLFSIAFAIPAARNESEIDPVFPGETWEVKTPGETGLEEDKLELIQAYMGGRGAIVRYGYLVYSWGEISLRRDIASAAKPFYAHFLLAAVEAERLASLDESVIEFEPCLNDINPDLGYKDRNITFRDMANQISDYGVTEAPGTAFNYNDWQIALFWDTLFMKVYGAGYADVDEMVFDPYLNEILEMQDDPTMMAFGTEYKPGRIAISVRDMARFGLLYLREGNWNGVQIISSEYARMATTDPVPNLIPRTAGEEAQMCPGQRSIGSFIVPDDQTDHEGSYSWLWWINGVDGSGNQKWPDGPADAFAALGHNNKRGMAVIPSLEIVIAWNDTSLDLKPEEPDPVNEVLKLIQESVSLTPVTPTPVSTPSPSSTYMPYVTGSPAPGTPGPAATPGPVVKLNLPLVIQNPVR
jgi:CubicO group peptidase (beta-lactamase class C family)